MTQSVNELINDKAVYRTAAATPSLLKIGLIIGKDKSTPVLHHGLFNLLIDLFYSYPLETQYMTHSYSQHLML